MNTNTNGIDFVIPLKQSGVITRAVLECIHAYYKPRRTIIITSRGEIESLTSLIFDWNVSTGEFVAEEDFFLPNMGLRIQDIYAEYDSRPHSDHREFGWWFQQLVKLGVASQIKNISANYVVWDGDLIALKRWEIYKLDENNKPKYFFAILQENARSQFNKEQYEQCMFELTGIRSEEPVAGGTFVAHHMVFNSAYVRELLELMSCHTGSTKPWPLLIMSFSKKYFRFSEYMTYASFMVKYHPDELNYHEYSLFGKNGMRFRDASLVIDSLRQDCFLEKNGFSYEQIRNFISKRVNTKSFQDKFLTTEIMKVLQPAYIQLEHVYG